MSTVTAFDTGGSPATQLTFAVSGRSTSAGNTVRNDAADGLTTATFITSPTASAGITQLPFVPRTVIVCVSSDPSGVDRDPTVSVDRVSMIRHGVIGQGLNDYDTIFRLLKEAGFDGWISIEDGMDGMDELRRSVNFLRAKIAHVFGG